LPAPFRLGAYGLKNYSVGPPFFMRLVSILLITFLFAACNGISKILKSKDPEYKLRMAEKYYVKKKYSYAYQLFEDVIPYYKTSKEFENIYYKMAYSTYYQKDYLSSENFFKTFLELFPNSSRVQHLLSKGLFEF